MTLETSLASLEGLQAEPRFRSFPLANAPALASGLVAVSARARFRLNPAQEIARAPEAKASARYQRTRIGRPRPCGLKSGRPGRVGRTIGARTGINAWITGMTRGIIGSNRTNNALTASNKTSSSAGTA